MIYNLFSDVLCNLNLIMKQFLTSWVSIFRIAETVYKCVANTNTTAQGQKNMNTQRTLDIEKVREFVGDFNKFFEDLKAWTEDAEQIRTWREHFWKSTRDIRQFF